MYAISHDKEVAIGLDVVFFYKNRMSISGEEGAVHTGLDGVPVNHHSQIRW